MAMEPEPEPEPEPVVGEATGNEGSEQIVPDVAPSGETAPLVDVGGASSGPTGGPATTDSEDDGDEERLGPLQLQMQRAQDWERGGAMQAPLDVPPSVAQPGAAFEPVSLEDIIAEHRQRQPARVGEVGEEATRARRQAEARQAALCLMVGVVGAAAIVVMVVVSWLRSSSEEEELEAGSG